MMIHGANCAGLAGDRGAVLGGGTAGIHVDGVDRVALLSETGNAVRRIEPAGEGEGNGWFLHSE